MGPRYTRKLGGPRLPVNLLAMRPGGVGFPRVASVTQITKMLRRDTRFVDSVALVCKYLVFLLRQ